MTRLFEPGRLRFTPGFVDLELSTKESADLLERHLSGDWGDLCPADKTANDRSLQDGTRLLSAYQTSQRVRVWIITEADRSLTTFLLPDEY